MLCWTFRWWCTHPYTIHYTVYICNFTWFWKTNTHDNCLRCKKMYAFFLQIFFRCQIRVSYWRKKDDVALIVIPMCVDRHNIICNADPQDNNTNKKITWKVITHIFCCVYAFSSLHCKKFFFWIRICVFFVSVPRPSLQRIPYVATAHAIREHTQTLIG